MTKKPKRRKHRNLTARAGVIYVQVRGGNRLWRFSAKTDDCVLARLG